MITNSINNKRYIGLSNNINRRFMEHRTPKNIANRTNVLYKAIRKYKIENFIFEILEIVDNESDLYSREVFWISKLKPEYNMNEGGLGNKGHSLSDDLKEHLRFIGKMQWESKTPLQKEFIIKNNLKRPKFGHPVSESTREKLRKANLGKKMSEETKIKISIANKNKIKDGKLYSKKVVAYNELEEIKFDSVKESAIYLKCDASNISKVLKGVQKTCRGYKFRYGV